MGQFFQGLAQGGGQPGQPFQDSAGNRGAAARPGRLVQGREEYLSGLVYRPDVFGHGGGLLQNIPGQGLQAAFGHADAESLGGYLGQEVGLVEHHRLVTGQCLAVTRGFQFQVGQEEMVVNHHNVGLGRLSPGLHEKAVVAFGAAPAQALLTGGADLGQKPRRHPAPPHMVQVSVLGFLAQPGGQGL